MVEGRAKTSGLWYAVPAPRAGGLSTTLLLRIPANVCMVFIEEEKYPGLFQNGSEESQHPLEWGSANRLPERKTKKKSKRPAELA